MEVMADALYLSLWYPNLRLAGLPDKLAAVFASFAAYSGEPYVLGVTIWPVNWHEAPVVQRVYGSRGEGQPHGADPKFVFDEIIELLHEDYAYELQIGWKLWELEYPQGGLDARWVRIPHRVSVIAFGPLFDEGAYEQEGHIRIDFGWDGSFLNESEQLSEESERYIAANVRQLLDLATAVEKASGATARLLWSELGESLAQRLAARLALQAGQGN
jgi:hypothetical protein